MTGEAQARRERTAGNGRIAVVTGAAGFLGREFVRQLTGLGWDVRGIDVVVPPDPPCEIVIGDIANRGRWADAITGADLVIHTAAIVTEAGDRARFHRVNVVGTRNVAEACEAGGVARLLHISSIVVYGTDFPDEVTEDAPLQPSGNPYTDTKVAAELEILRVITRGTLDVTIVRPGDVYGPGSQPWTIRPVQMMKRRLFVLVDGGSGILSPIFIEDLVDGAIVAATHPDAVGEAFNLTAGHGVPAKDFFEPYSAEKARTRLGWYAPTPFAEGMARTLDWLVKEGYIESARAEGTLWSRG